MLIQPQESGGRRLKLHGVEPIGSVTPAWTSAPREEAQQLLQLDLLSYWHTLLKRRWVVLATLLLCLAGGLAATLLMRPMFTSTATLQIDREAAKVINVEAVTPSDQMVAGEEFFETQYGLLRSRSLARRVGESLGMTRDDRFLRRMGSKETFSGPTAAAQRRDAVLEMLSDNLKISPVRGSRLVNVTFTSPEPALSRDIANAFTVNFITSNLDRRFESSAYARDFLERRLAQTKTKLEESERGLVAYAADQQIIQLTERGSGPNPAAERSLTAASLEALNASLAAATAERIAAEQRWVQARGAGLGVTEILANPTVQELTQTRARLRSEYQNKLATFLPDYPEMVQLRSQIDETERQLAAEANNIRASLKSTYAAALSNEDALRAQVGGLKGSVLDQRSRSIQYNILQREVDTNRALYDGLLQRYKEVGVAGGVTANNISVVDQADAAVVPSSPKPLINMALALAIGLVGGVLLAFGLEAMDQAIRVPADIETRLKLPVLGSVPIVPKGVPPTEALSDPRSGVSEAYHSLLSTLQFSTENGLPRSLVVTSSRPGEGKSTTAFAIAQNIAKLGLRTLLVDGDLRNPSLHKTLAADNRAGLTNILTSAATLQTVVQTTKSPNLFIVTAGPPPPNPAELLASNRLRAFLQEAAGQYDIVIFDGPPVMGLADAPMIAAVVSGTLLVIEAGKTAKVQAAAAVRRLQAANAHVLGALLTKFDSRIASYGYSYAYEYDYDYGKAKDGAKGKGRGGKAVSASALRRFIGK